AYHLAREDRPEDARRGDGHDASHARHRAPRPFPVEAGDGVHEANGRGVERGIIACQRTCEAVATDHVAGGRRQRRRVGREDRGAEWGKGCSSTRAMRSAAPPATHASMRARARGALTGRLRARSTAASVASYSHAPRAGPQHTLNPAGAASSVAAVNASTALLSHVLPTLVHVQASIPEAHPSAPILGTSPMQPGTLAHPDPLVLTVSYVVIGADSVRVTFLDQTACDAEVLRYDFVSGLALLKLPVTNRRALGLRRANEVALGDDVFIAASVGPDGARISSGAVSHLGPFDANWEYVLEPGIMTTAMNPGLGGGPLIDRHGGVVGVVSLNLSEIGRFALAIPADHFLDARDAWMAGARRAMRSRTWIGMFCQMLNQHVVIAGLLPGAPGEQAGPKPGDVVLAIDGQDVADRATLYRRVWARRPGDVITLRLFRGREVTEVSLTPGDVAEYFA